MFCKYCGKKIDKNSKFCEFCGRPIGKSDSKKINLEKDEDLVYIDSHDSTEFNDYDFDNVDDLVMKKILIIIKIIKRVIIN